MTEERKRAVAEGVVESGDGAMTVEDRARLMGWMSKDEFPGDPSKWMDADTFVRRAEEQLPILRSTLNRLERRLLEQNARMSAMQADFQHFVELAKRAQEQAYERALAELKMRQRQAVEERDTEAFEEAQRQYDELLRKHPAVTGSAEEDLRVVQAYQAAIEAEKRAAFEEWLAENPWFNQDIEMTDFAWKVDNVLTRSGRALSPREALNEITRQVALKFGQERLKNFKTANQASQQPKPVATAGVEAGGPSPGGGKRGKTYHDLPPEAKEVCDRLVRLGAIDKEQYVRTYFEAYPD
ncbi:MAG: hypothetical protein N3E40_01630 [Dehalococcoidia bacterium]|nr:hypothetical protein [Dehalococcoidia bacterium]